jgi:ABC-type phosphate/phosphonate transport system substrate-binding protein
MKPILHRMLRSVLLCAMAWTVTGPAAAEDHLVLSAAPRETPEQAEQLYGPLAERMSELLGRPVIYRHPGSWLAYQRDMRNDAYDILLDGPHLISWRMEEIGHQPLVRMPGGLRFYVVAPEHDSPVKALDDLVAKRICAVAPPNLASLVVLAQYPDVIRQPLIHPARRGMRHAFDEFRAGRCEAVALPTNFYDNILSEEDRRGTRVIFHSDPLPNQGISVSSRVGGEERARLVELFTTVGEQSTAPILQRFARGAEAFIPASEAEYQPHYRLLQGVIFGW